MKNLKSSLLHSSRQGLMGGFASANIFNEATLDLNFAKYKSLGSKVTHSRSSNATYVGGDGLIKDSVSNLLVRSEEFDNAAWTTIQASVTTNVTTAPDGTTTADKVNVSSNNINIRQQLSGDFKEDSTYTASVWVKAEGTNIGKVIRIGLRRSDSTPLQQTYSEITLTGSWQRVSQSITWTQDRTNISFDIRTDYTTGTAASEYYLWGAQLEKSSTAGEYVKTTSTINSAPRFDHDPETGESLGLLVEESRTNLVLRSEDLTLSPWSSNFSGAGVTATNGTYTAPDGSTTVTKLTFNQRFGVRQQDVNTSDGVSYTFSGYVKRISGPTGYTFLHWNSASGNNTLGLTVTDQWTRFKITVLGRSGGGNVAFGIQTTATSDFGELLVWGVQVEAGSFPTSYIPTEGSTVTRAADEASVSGNDFGTFNLVEYSEEFDNAYYSVFTRLTVNPNTAIAPNNTLTADKIIGTSNNDRKYAQFSANVVSGYQYALSLYAKKDEYEVLQLQATNQNFAGTLIYANFDLASGTVGSFADCSPTIESIGNGWYRCGLILPAATSSGSNGFRISPYASGDPARLASYTGDGTSGIYIWGAQLEESSTVTPYVKSDVTFTSRASTATYYDNNGVIRTAAVDEARNVAFLPDGNGNFVSAGELLLEDAGTNLVEYSEEFDEASWFKQRATISNANAIIAPDGNLSADRLQEDTTANNTHYCRQSFNCVSGTVYTWSCYLKNDNRRYARVTLGDGTVAFGNVFANVDLLLGTITGTGSDTLSSSITPASNGWYRVSITGEAIATLSYAHAYVFLQETTSVVTYTGDGTSGIYLWGAQLEESSYATSYIPTQGSTATRAADVSSSSSNTFGNSWYKQSEGTVFANAVIIGADSENGIAGLTNAGETDFLRVSRLPATSRPRSLVFDNSVAQADIQPTNTISIGQTFKLATVLKQNDFSTVLNGGSAAVDTSGTMPTVNQMTIGKGAFLTQLNGTVSRLTYWPTRLSNESLQAITS